MKPLLLTALLICGGCRSNGLAPIPSESQPNVEWTIKRGIFSAPNDLEKENAEYLWINPDGTTTTYRP